MPAGGHWTVADSGVSSHAYFALVSTALAGSCRTLLLPIRYRTIEDAMGICEALGERGDFLKPFASYDEYAAFFTSYLKADLQAVFDSVQTLLL